MQLQQRSRHRALNTNLYGQDFLTAQWLSGALNSLKPPEKSNNISPGCTQKYTSVQNNGMWRAKALPGEAGRGMYPWRRKQLRYQGISESEEKVAEEQQSHPELLRKVQHWLRQVEL